MASLFYVVIQILCSKGDGGKGITTPRGFSGERFTLADSLEASAKLKVCWNSITASGKPRKYLQVENISNSWEAYL